MQKEKSAIVASSESDSPITEDVLSPIRRSILADQAREGEKLQILFREHISDSHRRGVGVQGFTVIRLAEIYADWWENLGLVVWARLESLLKSPYPLTQHGLAKQLQREIREILREPFPLFEARAEQIASSVREPTRTAAFDRGRRLIEKRQHQVLARIDAEIERFVREVAEYRERESRNTIDNVTFYGRVLRWAENNRVLSSLALGLIALAALKGGIESLIYLCQQAASLWTVIRG